jgi:hypothetical protein
MAGSMGVAVGKVYGNSSKGNKENICDDPSAFQPVAGLY